jgi:hypothetical protein
MVVKARSEAAEFRFKYGYEMPVDYLARVLADQAQVYTQVWRLGPLDSLLHKSPMNSLIKYDLRSMDWGLAYGQRSGQG